MNPLPPAAYRDLVRDALKEDLGTLGDVTSRHFIAAQARLKGRIVARQAGVVCGVDLARAVFKLAAPGSKVKVLLKDGARVRPGQALLEVSGGRGLLTAERTALNFLQRLSGVATLTALYVEKIRGMRAKIYDTRKTLPGWRVLDKYAVRCGGGVNHRMGLFDAVMLKDNHWASGGDIAAGVRALRLRHPKMTLEIEADELSQVVRALELGADVVLLDNMTKPELRKAIAWVRKTSPRTQIEVSGGVDLTTVRALAALGSDRISIGRLTHSAPALDLGLDFA